MTPAWESPVADQVAAAWGYPAGTAKWWRSSASHVFVLRDPEGKRYLRFVPDANRSAGPVAAVCSLMDRLVAGGAAVVRPVPTLAGTLTATVPTALGLMHAMVVEAAPGEELDVEELDEDRARSWGAALAAVHESMAGIDADLPEAFPELSEITDLYPHDPALVKAALRLADRIAGLPRDGSRFGIVHGDFELDNLAWDEGRATAFDFDEVAFSWYAADIAYALRDLTGPDGLPAVEHRQRSEEFIAGYRSVRPLGEADLANLRLFAGAHAVCSLVRIDSALDTPGEDEPQWMADLRARLTAMARSHRELAIGVAEAL
ncbi:phosphotransferase enzyme family protein [Glycomyces rhizosphaerae]|uniref:Phosphotransferase enzyme family protein n=1 Tax=Glycomyces rhizosphaerae TaxID=2054422 RepID=A0ABV7Q243_9ACTN